MLRSSGLGVSLRLSAVALLPDVVNASIRGVRSSLYKSNALAIADYQINTDTQHNAALDVLVDPQTSGGLLAAVPPDCAEQCVMALYRAGYPAAAIGELCAPDRQEIVALRGIGVLSPSLLGLKTCDGWSKLIHVDKKRVVALCYRVPAFGYPQHKASWPRPAHAVAVVETMNRY